MVTTYTDGRQNRLNLLFDWFLYWTFDVINKENGNIVDSKSVEPAMATAATTGSQVSNADEAICKR